MNAEKLKEKAWKEHPGKCVVYDQNDHEIVGDTEEEATTAYWSKYPEAVGGLLVTVLPQGTKPPKHMYSRGHR